MPPGLTPMDEPRGLPGPAQGQAAPDRATSRVTEVVVLTTAMLTFISFWRAGAVVLCDMASTAWYIGGIAEQAIGKAAPWFILAVMSFSACMLAVYMEGSAMFVRGGVYKVVREAMGGTLAKVSVSALMFDYVLTGPISSVSAGQYLAGLLNAAFPVLRIDWKVSPDSFSVVFALLATAYFWRRNLLGIEESSEDASRIISLTGVMAVALFAWGGYTLYARGFAWPPLDLTFGKEAFGWLDRFDWAGSVGAFGVMVGLGHAFLGMSGLETLAQVYREIESPKVSNLKKTVVFIFVFAFLLTTVSTFMAVAIIPDAARGRCLDNLLGGLALHLEGPRKAVLLMQAFVVATGALILSGAVNTSMVGANGVLNRVAEDGVMPGWFRKLHPRHGTTSRMVNLIGGLQVATILLSRGDVYVLGEAYAFGLLWSFVFNVSSLVILRFKDRSPREWMVPLNIPWGGRLERPVYLPVGLSAIWLVVSAVAVVNLFTKPVATVWGAAFTAGFYLLFRYSERVNRLRAAARKEHTEEFNLAYSDDVADLVAEQGLPNRVLVTIRNPANMYHLIEVLRTADPESTEVVVLHSKRARGLHLSGTVAGMGPDEQGLFTNVIAAAEKHGVTVRPVMVVSNDPAYAVAQVAQSVGATEIVMGPASTMAPDAQLEKLAMALGAAAAKLSTPVKARILSPGGKRFEMDIY